MNEEEFRQAVRAQVDAHIRRLRITYSVLFGTAEALRRLARVGGVDEQTIAEVLSEEAERIGEVFDELSAAPPAADHPSIH